MTDLFLPTPALFRGLGFSGWRGTSSEEALKIAMICGDRLLVPLSRREADPLLERFSSREGLNLDQVRSSFCLGQIAPDLFDEDFVDRTQLFLFRGWMDRRIRENDRVLYLGLLAALVMARRTAAGSWYNQLYERGLFYALDFIDSAMWDRLSQKRGDVFMMATDTMPSDYRILRRFLSVPPMPGEFSKARKALFDIHVPDFGTIPWDTIFQLRKDRRVDAFRDHLDSLCHSEDRDTSHAVKVLERVWKVVEGITPSVPEAVLRTAASSTPLPLPFNPLAAGASLLALVRKLRWRQSHRWFTFVQAMREARDDDNLSPSFEPGDPFIGPGTFDEKLTAGFRFATNVLKAEYLSEVLDGEIIKGPRYEFTFVGRADGSIDVWRRRSRG